MPFVLNRNRTLWTLAVLWLVLLSSSLVQAATLDPLLRTVMTDKGTGPALQPERFLVLDPGKDAGDPLVGVILHLEGGRFNADLIPGFIRGSRRGRFVTGRLPLSSLQALNDNSQVAHVEAARLQFPLMDLATVDAQVDEVWQGAPAFTGDGVLVGVIDSGIDWAHADFKTAGGSTRIVNIWDQYANGTSPSGFNYGAEYNATQINAGTVGEEDLSGHGSHVTGIAAGNGLAAAGQYSGVAPEADIIFVKAFDDAQGGFPEDKTIDAMNYLAAKAESLGQPIAINMSLGGHMGPHDGSTAQEQLIDELSGTGVVFCIAAGNEGEDYLHDSGPASNTDLALAIHPYTPNGGGGNDYVILNLWVEGAGNPTVTVSFGGTSVGPIASGQSGGEHTGVGTVVIDNATGGADPNNGDKQIIIQIDDDGGTPPASGDWEITISGGTGTADAWVARSSMGAFFSDSDQTVSVGMPGTAESAVTVAAHKTRQNWTSIGGSVQYHPETSWGLADVGDHAPFSSFGPTRDGRQKPDISAPGQGIFAPYSSDTYPYPGDAWLHPDGEYLLSQGTSMASPFICGVAALMLEKNGTLSADQIKNILRVTAHTDEYTGTVWNERFGAGKVDALAAVQAVSTPGPPPTGDVDGDELTTVLDLVRLVNHIIDPTGHPLDSEARAQGDVYPSPSGDGLLNASDLARIMAFILESDDLGYSAPGGSSVDFQIAEPVFEQGQWWQPVKVGGGVAVGQFALVLDGASWDPDQWQCDADVQVVAKEFGSQLRVLVYSPGGGWPADGLTLRLPFDHGDENVRAARSAGVVMAAPGGAPLTVHEGALVVQGFLKAAPNPSPGEVMVSFSRHRGADYDLSVFDLRGRRVRSLRGGEDVDRVVFDGKGDDGRALPAGVYFLRYRSDRIYLTEKIVLTR